MVQLIVSFLQPVPPGTPLSPIVVEVAGSPIKEIGVIDSLLGAFGITGLLLIGSALMGILVAAVIFKLRARTEAEIAGQSLASAQLHLTERVPPRG